MLNFGSFDSYLSAHGAWGQRSSQWQNFRPLHRDKEQAISGVGWPFKTWTVVVPIQIVNPLEWTRKYRKAWGREWRSSVISFLILFIFYFSFFSWYYSAFFYTDKVFYKQKQRWIPPPAPRLQNRKNKNHLLHCPKIIDILFLYLDRHEHICVKCSATTY